MSKTDWTQLNRRIEQCENCPRLRDYCSQVAEKKRAAYRDQDYWGKPVANFGPGDAMSLTAKSIKSKSIKSKSLKSKSLKSKSLKSKSIEAKPFQASLLIVGLAPGAHGANRTGRMFTGDRSGQWLFRALHKAGFANQSESVDRSDGLQLHDCVITNICHCAPPGNQPLPAELLACRPFFEETYELCQPRVVIALGGLAWKATLKLLFETDRLPPIRPQPKFGHGAAVQIDQQRWLLGSYHVSQQNTFTGRLTEPMLDAVFATAKKLIG